MKETDFKPSWIPALKMLAGVIVIGALGLGMLGSEEWTFKLFGAIFALGAIAGLVMLATGGKGGRGPCPQCGATIENMGAKAENVRCADCNSYMDITNGKIRLIEEDRIESIPTFSAPLPWNDLANVTYPTIALSGKDYMLDKLRTKEGHSRVFSPTWPAGCCVCRKPAVEHLTAWRIVVKAGNVRNTELAVIVDNVPCCAEHKDGVALDRASAGNPGAYNTFSLLFRSLGYRNDFLQANPPK